jgi:pimeloyl-ACP methyl ester carboxylesterase
MGVRLISPDRPGIGLSDPQPDRTIRDWADDIADLLDQLGVDRFAVMGWSMVGSTPRRSVTRCGRG